MLAHDRAPRRDDPPTDAPRTDAPRTDAPTPKTDSSATPTSGTARRTGTGRETTGPIPVRLPAGILPRDGRFGAGPSKIRPEAIARLAGAGRTTLGTSHRRAPVSDLVRRLRQGLRALYDLPDDYAIALGNGGATAFFDALAASVIDHQSAHAVCGAFSAKLADAVDAAPHLAPARRWTAPFGQVARLEVEEGIDTCVLTHCETSTGVLSPLDCGLSVPRESLVVADGTSAAGGVPLEPGAVDIYFFSLQKGMAADGGLWAAFFSPAAQARIRAIRAATRRSADVGRNATRWIPTILDLEAAITASAKDQTVNTPAVATLVLAVAQIEWLLEEGGLAFGVARSAESARRLYGWAERSPIARPFVDDPAARSPVVATIELDPTVDARTVVATLRAHGIVDLDPYRGVGQNQIRVGLFPAIDPDDVEALTRCLDTVIEALGG